MFNKIISLFKLNGISDLDYESMKLSKIRIIIGIIVFIRSFQIFHSTLLLEGSNGVTFFNAFILLLLAFFTIGFFTQEVSVLILLLYTIFDSINSTSTLGTAVFGILMLVLFFLRSNRFYSIDNYFKIKSIFKFQPTLYDFKIVYVTGFIIYGVISLCAISYHLIDLYWKYGQTTQVLLTNSYLVNISTFFRSLLAENGRLLFYLSIFSIVGQTVFQFFMIPLMFFNIGRKFVVLWGLGFFVFCLFFIGLSYLPHVEIAIWFLFFYRLKGDSSRELETKSTPIVKYFSIIIISFSFIFLILNNVLTKKLINNNNFEKTKNEFNLLVKRFGFLVPIVFNSIDLKMGDNWVVIKKRNKIIPLVGEEGERLSYSGFDPLLFGNHNSDVLYFGNTLTYRRAAITLKRDVLFSEKDYLFDLFLKRIKFDYSYTNEKGKVDYFFYFYSNNSSDYRMINTKFKKKLNRKVLVRFDGKNYKVKELFNNK